MNILITGASGFIGHNLGRRLQADGHHILACVRNPEAGRVNDPEWQWLASDFGKDDSADVWFPRLEGVDVVINAVGIIIERRDARFETIQASTPIALFKACLQRGIKVLQVSAMGADDTHVTVPFLASKKQADDFLWNHSTNGQIVYPSVVIGRGGDSTALFMQLAALPVTPLIGRGDLKLNPVHVDDLCAVVSYLVAHWPEEKQRHSISGDEIFSFRELLELMRDWLGMGKAILIPVPLPVMRLAAGVSGFLKMGALNQDNLELLLESRLPAPTSLPAGQLGLPARMRLSPATAADIWLARFSGIFPVLWLSLAMLWIFTGLTSAVFAVDSGFALLDKAGIPEWLAPWAVYGGAAVDMLLGLLLLGRFRVKSVLQAQMAMMLAYMGIVSVILPQEWLNPLGPITKNLPLLAATWILLAYESVRHP